MHGLGEKPYARAGIEYFVPRGGKGDCNEPHQRNQSYGGVASTVQFDDDRRGDAKSDRGKQLVGDAEQRPERVDAAQRILYALPEEESPGGDDEGAGGED